MNNYQYPSDRLCYPRVGCPDEKSRERNSPGTIWGGASQISLIGMHDHESNDWNAYSTFRSDFKPHLAPFANNVHGHERTRRYLINWNNYPSIGDLNNKSKPAQRVCSFCAIELRPSRIKKYTKDLPNHKHQRRGVGCPTKTPPLWFDWNCCVRTIRLVIVISLQIPANGKHEKCEITHRRLVECLSRTNCPETATELRHVHRSRINRSHWFSFQNDN